MSNGRQHCRPFVFVLVFLLVSCKINLDVNDYEKNTWFRKETLDLCLVSDFPIIEGSEFLKVNDENIYVNWEYERYKDYVVTFYEYIKSKQFVYLGTRGEEHDTFVGAFTTYYFEPAQGLELGISKKHIWVAYILDDLA